MKELIERINKRINTEVLRIGAYDGELVTLLSQCKAALSQKQEAKPVFMWHKGATDEESEVVDVDCACECCVPLYTAPPSTAQVSRDDVIQCIFATHKQSERVMADAILSLFNHPSQPTAQEDSPTKGMSLEERIAHVGGRENEQGYVEFGSPMAVKALIDHVLRDVFASPTPAVPDDLQDARRWRWIRDNFKFLPTLDEHGSDWSAPELDELVDTMLTASQAGEPPRGRGGRVMDNKQLLERVAKAAGYRVGSAIYVDQNDKLIGLKIKGASIDKGLWNPIDNDADAFRLMVDCSIDVVQSRHEVFATAYDWEKMERGEPFTELFPDHNNDKHAATRMAVVRAAAQSQENA